MTQPDALIALYIGLTMSLTQLIKSVLDMIPPRIIPVISLIIGICFALYSKMDIVSGLIIGLSASGLYSGVKTIAQK